MLSWCGFRAQARFFVGVCCFRVSFVPGYFIIWANVSVNGIIVTEMSSNVVQCLSQLPVSGHFHRETTRLGEKLVIFR
jgi:hypothetical protein